MLTQLLDGIHEKALKELAEILANPLTIIFNTSIQTDPGNYRPVSLTSVVGKLMEKFVRKVIVNHIIKNDLYSKNNLDLYQGDQPHYSCC